MFNLQKTQDTDFTQNDRLSLKSLNKVHSLGEEINTLHSKILHLSMINEALWNIIKVKLNISDTELLQEIDKLDLTDGVKNNKKKVKIHKCDKCGKALALNRNTCMFCGHEYQLSNPFEKIQ